MSLRDGFVDLEAQCRMHAIWFLLRKDSLAVEA